MAFEKDLLEQEDQEKEEIGMQPLTQQSSSGPTSSGGQSQQKQRTATSKPGSGMFTNIQKYQTKPAEEEAKGMATKMGQDYQDRFSNVKQQTEQQIGDWENTYDIAGQEQRLQTAGDKARQYIEQAGTQDQETLQARSEELANLRQAKYNDPNAIDLSKQKLEEQRLSGQVSDPSVEASTRQALKNVYERPDYFQGMRNLDYMMMRQEPAQNILRTNAQDVAGKLGEFNIAGQEQSAIDRDEALGNLARSYQAGGERDLTGDFARAETQLHENIQAGEGAEKQRRLDELSRIYGSSLPNMGLDVTGYRNLSEGELITPEQIARANALGGLAGRDFEHEAANNTFNEDYVNQLQQQLGLGERSAYDQYSDPRNRLLDLMRRGQTHKTAYGVDSETGLESGTDIGLGAWETPEGIERDSRADIEAYIRSRISNPNFSQTVGRQDRGMGAGVFYDETPDDLIQYNTAGEIYDPNSQVAGGRIGDEQIYDRTGYSGWGTRYDGPIQNPQAIDSDGYQYAGTDDLPTKPQIWAESVESTWIPQYLNQLQDQRDQLRSAGYEVDDSFLEEIGRAYDKQNTMYNAKNEHGYDYLKQGTFYRDPTKNPFTYRK